MIPVIIFALSIGLQLAAALFALLLIRTSRRKLAWILIALAMVLMAGRRMVSFFSLLASGKEITLEVPELIALIISCLMLVGVLRIGDYFCSIQATEDTLRKSEEEHRMLIENINEIIYMVSIGEDPLKGRVDLVSGQVKNIIGYGQEDFLKDPELWFRIIHPDDAPVVSRFAPGLIEKQEKTTRYYRIRHKETGEYRWLEDKVIPIIDDKGHITGLFGVARDITERKRLEEQLLHSQKMEAIGQLAGGVAHEFNNILTAIIGYGNILLMKMKGDDPLRHNVEQILASSERAAGLTQGLLTYSRKQITAPRPENLNDMVKKTEGLLLRIIGEDIELRTVLSGEELTVMADRGQMEQVLMNLATNARDAMPDGGSLTISTELVEIDMEFINIHGYGEPGMYALISVADTGIGIEKKMMEKIFEPFFTTKEIGKGTGLGLAMVYGIIKQHDGYINVYSESGKGTTFKIYLPVIKAKIREKESSIIQLPIGGTETVLVAEDDKALRKLIKTVLGEFGYKVIDAVDGEDAVEKFMENKDRIDLLVFDVIMPKKNGKEAYEEIKKINPMVKALFTSGYTSNIIHKKGILEEGINFILKPVSPKELLRKVREILDR